jgi:hypothetical protein
MVSSRAMDIRRQRTKRWKSELAGAGHTTIFSLSDGKYRPGNRDSAYRLVGEVGARQAA